MLMYICAHRIQFPKYTQFNSNARFTEKQTQLFLIKTKISFFTCELYSEQKLENDILIKRNLVWHKTWSYFECLCLWKETLFVIKRIVCYKTLQIFYVNVNFYLHTHGTFFIRPLFVCVLYLIIFQESCHIFYSLYLIYIYIYLSMHLYI